MSTCTRDRRQSHLEGKVARVVVESTAEHKREDVLDRLRAEDALIRDWADSSLGQRGRHHALRLTGHLQRARLRKSNESQAHWIKYVIFWASPKVGGLDADSYTCLRSELITFCSSK